MELTRLYKWKITDFNMKKVYFFANCHSSPGEQSGGDKRFREIFKRMNEFEKIIITSKFGFDIYKKEMIKTKYFLTSTEKKQKNIFLSYFGRTIKSLLLNLEISKGDILYSASDFFPDVFPAFVLKLKNKNVKWVQVVHHLYENPFKRKGKSFLVNLIGFLLQRASFTLIRRRADLTIVVNPIARQQLSKMGFNEKKIYVNYNGVNLKKIQSFQLSNKKYDCVFLGRLNVSKGIYDLVEIWKNLITKNPYARLAIIGRGDKQIEQKLKNKITKNKLEKNIDVLGYVEDVEAFGILKSSKIFVFPSYEEGFGIAILEAMACGLPVVAWNLPLYKKLFPKGIICVHMGNIEQYANEIRKLLMNSKLYEKISNDAVEVASRYDWDKIAQKELELIERLAKEK